MRTSCRLGVLGIVVAAFGAAKPLAQDQPPPPVFQTGAEVVRVDFVVTDKSGRPVQGLTAQDFVVKQDGKDRPIVAFEAVGRPDALASADASDRTARPNPPAPQHDASTIVLVDDFHLTPDQAARLRPALKNLLSTLQEPSTGLMLVAPGSQVSLLAERSTAVTSLLPVVDRIVGRRRDEDANFPIADAEALAIARRDVPTLARVVSRFVAINPDLRRDDAETIAIENGTKLAYDVRVLRDSSYDQALICLDWLARRPGRHSLIIVSGGFPQDEADSKYDEVITRSLRANAPIDFLDARGLSGFNPYHDAQYGALLKRDEDEGPFGRYDEAAATTALADDTGGVVISNTNDLDKGFHRLLDMMSSYYVLAYDAPLHQKRGFHKIKVETRRKGVHVQARRGYFSDKK